MNNASNLTYKLEIGQRFGSLTIVGFEKRFNSKGTTYRFWKCLCDCGNTVTVRTDKLTCCNKTNCGRAHGSKKSPERLAQDRLRRIIWSARKRCNNPQDTAYPRYGGRGISVCEEWQGDKGSNNFIMWALANGYHRDLQLDRRDNDGNYCPENCRWVTAKVNCNNTSKTRKVVYKGKEYSYHELYDQFKPDVCYQSFFSRLQHGWTMDEALFKPKRNQIRENFMEAESNLHKIYTAYEIPSKLSAEEGREHNTSTFDVTLTCEDPIEWISEVKSAQLAYKHHTTHADIKSKYAKSPNSKVVLYTKEHGKSEGYVTVEEDVWAGMLAFWLGVKSKEDIIEAWGANQ